MQLNPTQFELIVNLNKSYIQDIFYSENGLHVLLNDVGIRKNQNDLLNLDYIQFVQKLSSQPLLDQGWHFGSATLFFKGGFIDIASVRADERKINNLIDLETPYPLKNAHHYENCYYGIIDKTDDNIYIWSLDYVFIEFKQLE